MEPIDIVALGVVALSALAGFRRGLLVGILSLTGLVGGAILGARVAPELLGAENSRWVPLVTLGGALVVSAIVQSLAVMVGRRVRSLFVGLPPLKALDHVGGGMLGALTGLALCWALGAVLLYLPGDADLRRWAQESAVLSTLNEAVPPDRLMDALGRIDPFLIVAGPDAGVAPPSEGVVAAPGIVRAGNGVVRVTGHACGLGVEGSGWIAAPGIVVTAAHVVAGVSAPRVDRRDGRFVTGTVVAFDVRNDLAVIRAPGLRGRPLPVAEPEKGEDAAILGFPGNGPFTSTAARMGKTVNMITRDAYGSFPVTRSVTLVRGDVRPGNSGGPVVSTRGEVLASIFGARAGNGSSGYAAPAEEIVAVLAAERTPLETSCAGR